jgi:DNA-directed RNA polymerase subunit RPC12/RpoP
MNRPLVVCAVVVFLAGVGYLVYSRYVSPPPDRGYGYLYCPKCGLEQKAGADQKDRKVLCPRCGPWPQPMVYSTWSQAESGGDVGLLVPAICVGGLGAMGLLYAYISVVRPRLRGGAGAGKVHRFRCPGCRRKFQFTRTQVGRHFTCPKCHHEIVIPAPSKG